MVEELSQTEAEIDRAAEQRVLLTLPARPEYITLSRLALAALGGQGRLADDTIADLKVAVSEACAYVLRLVGPDPAAATAAMRVEYLVSPDRWVVQVSSPAGPLSSLQPDDQDPLSESNLGLTIIRALVDELDLTTGEDGQGLLRLIKRLS